MTSSTLFTLSSPSAGPTVGPTFLPLASAAQARAADAYTIEDLGVPGIVLMEHAGRAVARVARQAAPAVERALVLAGPGNNGGDGWVAARHLWSAGIPCPVLTLRAPDTLEREASQAAQMFLHAADARGWRAGVFDEAFMLIDAADDLLHFLDILRPDVIIDALFGSGMTRPLEGLPAFVVQQLARTRLPIVSVDLPSGLPTDGGAPQGPVVRAHTTITFGQKKIAHASEPGRFWCGTVVVEDIGILGRDEEPPAALELVDARPLLPSASPAGHKGSFGHVGVVVGAPGLHGAARLAGRAALRTGCGLVTLLGDDDTVDVPEPELMSGPLSDDALAHVNVLVVGPGTGGSLARAHDALDRAMAHGLPCVVDAEALDLLTAGRRTLRGVATPHPGEAARLLGTTAADVQLDRIAAARALRRLLPVDVAVVLKGACPIVVLGDGHLVIVPGGHPALAVAGSGDVLAGIIGSLLARGLAPEDAALCGAELHQRTGARLTRGALASDIADTVADVLRESTRAR